MLQGREGLNQTLYWALGRRGMTEAWPLLLLALFLKGDNGDEVTHVSKAQRCLEVNRKYLHTQ